MWAVPSEPSRAYIPSVCVLDTVGKTFIKWAKRKQVPISRPSHAFAAEFFSEILCGTAGNISLEFTERRSP